MTIPPADLGFIEHSYRSAARAVVEAYADRNVPPEAPPGLGDTAPGLLVEAMERLLDILHNLQPDRDTADPGPGANALEAQLEAQDIHALGDYGIRLLSDLAEWAHALRLADPYRELRNVLFSLALWIVQRDGELSTLEPVVDALAFLANNIRARAELERLFLAAGEIMESVSPAISQDLDRSNPGRPWRVLLQNRAIIATRSHQPALMEQAFATLVEMLPEDAPAFFREGMEQMEALDYPQPVRRVMEKYFQLWCTSKTLH
jgi:hypothetical protein